MMSAAWNTHADALNLLTAASGDYALDRFDQPFGRGLGVSRGRHHFLRSELAVRIGERHRGLRRTDIDADDHAFIVQAEEGRAASARESAGGTFEHPVLLDQLLND